MIQQLYQERPFFKFKDFLNEKLSAVNAEGEKVQAVTDADNESSAPVE